ncbi:hypothetical protein HCDG_02346 [Histoplasma capsulatum H143]|uniref:Glucose-methanol-choline oxidoreductase N-terminal domain-containing protein n=1 Tax=Ajellomyces capsulatus (strain H143) TaxID=544712 RepID=C6H7E5_AJECH|nr:hypothetical protein HCDG_02346 [Histoplasma capsulatum H143]
MTIPDEVDIVVCGGGSSGYFPVGRILANLNNRLRVLLIETDEDVSNNLWKENSSPILLPGKLSAAIN